MASTGPLACAEYDTSLLTWTQLDPIDAGDSGDTEAYDRWTADAASDAAEDLDRRADVHVFPCTEANRDCDADPVNGCETDTQTDGLHCGECSHSCRGGECHYGSCQPVVLAAGLSNPWALAVDPLRGDVYWTEYAAPGRVARVAVTGGPAQEVVREQLNPVHLQVDLSGLYWVAQGPAPGAGTVNAVARERLDAFSVATGPVEPQVLAQGEPVPLTIAVDGVRAYWTNWVNHVGSVRAVPLEGGMAESVATNQIFAAAIVSASDEIYWATLGTGPDAGMIRRWNKGAPPDQIETLTLTTRPTGLAVDDTHVYWGTLLGLVCRLDRQLGQGVDELVRIEGGAITGVAERGAFVYFADQAHGSVQRITKTGGAVTTLAAGQLTPTAVVVDDVAVYWTDPGDGTVKMVAK